LYIIVSTIIFTSNSTIISLSFNDGYKSHLTVAQWLYSSKINATFFLNSNNLSFKDEWLNVFDVNNLVLMGFEIGGHTLDHLNLATQDSPTILEQVCRDRARLFANGWIATSFSYPLGKYTPLTNLIVGQCGYNSALVDVSIGNNNTSTSIIYVQDSMKLPYYDVPVDVSYDELINQVTISKGITIFNFHQVDITINNPLFRFIDWLKTKRDATDIVVKSIDQLVQQPVRSVPIEYRDTEPTYTPDPDSLLKIYIGAACLCVLFLLVLYVIITTQIKRRKKIKFPC